MFPDEPADWPDEASTRVTCLACGGERIDKCRWCTDGAMTPAQAEAWLKREDRVK
jgi:hypothetical protein